MGKTRLEKTVQLLPASFPLDAYSLELSHHALRKPKLHEEATCRYFGHSFG